MTEPIDGAERTHNSKPEPSRQQVTELPDWAAQKILAAMMNAPETPLLSLIQIHYSDRGDKFISDVFILSKKAIAQVLDGLHKSTESEPAPILVDRISFTWRLLRQADILLRKAKLHNLSENSTRAEAAAIFSKILDPLFPKLHEPLLLAILEWLRLGADGQYLSHYWLFRRAGPPARLRQSFSSSTLKQDPQLLRRLIWWCLRGRREEYIEVGENSEVRIEYLFVIDEILNDLKKCSGPELLHVPHIGEEVEREVNSWLKYSRLDNSSEDAGAESARIDPDMARAFLKHNGLDIKLRVLRTSSEGATDERVRQLEAELQQYAECIRALESRIETLQSASNLASTPPEYSPNSPTPPPIPESEVGSFTELREVLKTIDSKYSFDALNALQRGEETHLTLRSFTAHFFYALRRRGFTEYPTDHEFTLTYDASGLFECEGFEVPPTESIPVRVTRKGWALKSKGRWLPVRRARVTRADVTPS